MNLKEAFRYQNYLDGLMANCYTQIGERANALVTDKKHNRKAVNPDAQDMSEPQDYTGIFSPDDIMKLMQDLIKARQELCEAITRAKAQIGFDVDAALETVKFRRTAANGVKALLRYKASKRTDKGQDYKFNVEGNQVPYAYDIEVTTTENFDRETARKVYKTLLAEADEMSSKIDKAYVDATVDFKPPWDVNDAFEDVIPTYAAGSSSTGRKD